MSSHDLTDDRTFNISHWWKVIFILLDRIEKLNIYSFSLVGFLGDGRTYSALKANKITPSSDRVRVATEENFFFFFFDRFPICC